MKWVKAGFCFNLVSQRTQLPHLWVVITNPEGSPPEVAAVNLTGHKDGADETVIINVGEHPFITKKTVVKYAAAGVVQAERIERAIEDDLSLPHRTPCSPELLEKIRRGIFASRFTPPAVKSFCRDKF